ncbi:MAG: hypothetical protein AB8B56_09630, partial [Crocinitomicaceae bacterium]
MQKVRIQRQDDLKKLHELEDFNTLTKHVYGKPLPGEDLPFYRGKLASLDEVFADLNSTQVDKEKAVEYIEEELKLIEEQFRTIFQTGNNLNASDADKKNLYRLLELADRQIRSFTLPSPSAEKLSDLYATTNARDFAFSEYEEEEESKRFKTLGNRLDAISDQSLKPAELGFAFSSPILLLEEGRRKIELLLDLGANEADIETLETVFENNEPLQTYISTEKDWFAPEELAFTFGNYVGEAMEGAYVISVSGQTIISENNIIFDDRDIGRYFVDDTQNIYEILALKSQKELTVKEVGRLATEHPEVKKYDRNQVYLNSLKIEVLLREDSPAIVALGDEVESTLFRSDDPSLVFTLSHALKGLPGKQSYRSAYEHFVNLGLHKAHLQVDVNGMKNVVLQNDRNNIDAKKPFEPFGFEPATGDSFYIANTEVCQKRLKDLRIDMEWVKLPESLKEHYENYWKIQTNKSVLIEDDYLIKNNNDFKAALFFHDKNAEVLLSKTVENAAGEEVSESASLFENGGEIVIDDLPMRMKQTSPGYRYNQLTEIASDDEEVREWDRY